MEEPFNLAHRLLDGAAVGREGKVAIRCEGDAVSYGELAANVKRFGNLLRHLKRSPGDRILLVLPDCCEFFYAFLGSILFGAWPVPVHTGLTGPEYEFLARDSEASLLVTTAESEASRLGPRGVPQTVLVDRLANPGWLSGHSPELDPHPSRKDDIAFMLYSSGSTGSPKGVPHRHGDLLLIVEAYGRGVLGVSPEDVLYSASKLSFAYGLGASLAFPLAAGASVVLVPGRSTPATALDTIARDRPSLFFGVPTFYNLLLRTLEEGVRLPSLRLAVSAGEALPATTYRAWKARTGVELLDGFGSTEAMHIFISNYPGDVRPGSSGRVVPPFQVKIVDDAGRPVRPGEAGHLLVRGESTAPCYWNRPDKTRETMLEGGWLRTGDICRQEDGYYIHQGRGDDMFKVEAQWLSPVRVEEALRDHPAVLECAVTSRKLEGLVRPVAYVALAAGYEGKASLGGELIRHAAQRLPAWMCPVQVLFCAEIPKTSTGKIQRFRLRQAAAEGSHSTNG